jgi:hypothetical protein
MPSLKSTNSLVNDLIFDALFEVFVVNAFQLMNCRQVHAAQIASAIAGDNSRAEVISISTETGKLSLFDPTGEKSSDGRVIYKNRVDPTLVIEHVGGKWQIKPVSVIGKNIRAAEVSGGCPLEACKEKVWMVLRGDSFEEKPSMKMETGAKAEAQASGGCIVAFFSMPSPPLSTLHAHHCST